jgi:hypothetical protein
MAKCNFVVQIISWLSGLINFEIWWLDYFVAKRGTNYFRLRASVASWLRGLNYFDGFVKGSWLVKLVRTNFS